MDTRLASFTRFAHDNASYHKIYQIKVMVAGGSSMPLVLEDFFDMIRTPVIVGYGMTVRMHEYTPICALQHHPHGRQG